ncbi:MAG: GNAT family N-acetyltransferase [Planctomycetaceae bacterium]|jgi:hypothetical protein|nr:GNAT family N-acetyltransferase [Planctomycetaceae bacterium]
METKNGGVRNPSLRKTFMSKFIRKILACCMLFRRWQFFALFQYFSARFIPTCLFGLNKHVFYSLSRESLLSSPDINEIESKVEIELGNEKTVAEIVRDLYSDDSEALEFYANFYRDGIMPYVARVDGKTIGVVWLYVGYYLANWEGYESWLLRIGIEPTSKFVANVFVDPLWRGRKIFHAIISRCVSIYCNDKLYSCVDELNITSIMAHERIGFCRCAVAYYIRFFRFAYCIFLTEKGKGRWGFRCFRLPRGKAVSILISDTVTNSDLKSE